MANIESEQYKEQIKPTGNDAVISEQIPNPKEQQYLEELKEGKYLGILETYVSDEKWTMERVARDTWQNFFDANGGTLDNIKLNLKEENGEIVMTIHGDAQYDFRRLLHLGAGSKIGSTKTAGKYGEGTRIYALHMLRDYGFQRVKFKSGKWELEFYLDRAPRHEVPEEMKDARGLFAKISILEEEYPGNEVKLITVNKENAEVMQKARDLFYHSENQDFRHPDVDTDKGGLKIHFGQMGNLYINGQRIHFNSRDEWLTLPDMSIWTWETPHFGGQSIKLGRERSLVTLKELHEIVLPFLVNSMSIEECQMLVAVLEPVYDIELHSGEASEKLLSLLAARLAAHGQKVDFPKNFLAHDVSSSTAEILKKIGYKLCRPYLGNIGMKKASEEFKDFKKIHSVEMNETERKRAELVQNAIRNFLKESEVDINIQAKPIRAFIGEHPFLHGQYDEEWVFINKFVLSSCDLAQLLALYKHEICHAMGPDESAIFTYAYTDLDEEWTRYIIKHPEVLQTLNADFLAIKETSPDWKSYDDFAKFVDPLLEKEAQDISSPLHYFSHNIRENKIRSAKSSLERIVEDKFSANYSAKNMIAIYETILQNDLFKKVREFLDKTQAYLTPEEESTYKTRLQELNLRRSELEKMIRAERDKITSRTKRRRVAKRAIRESKIPLWEKEIDQLHSQIEEINQKLETSLWRPYLFARLKAQNIFGREVDLSAFLSIEDVVTASLELIVERNAQKPMDDIIKEIDEMLIYLKRNAAYPKNVHNAIVIALSRIKQVVYLNPSKVNLNYSQRLFREIVETI